MGGDVDAGGSSLENLHAMVEGVSHHDAPVAVDGNAAIRAIQLSVASAAAADGANMGTIAVAQHLHSMIVSFNDNNVTCSIERDTRGTIELAGACSFAADGAEMLAVAVAQNLNTMVVTVGNNKVAFAIKQTAFFNAPRSIPTAKGL